MKTLKLCTNDSGAHLLEEYMTKFGAWEENSARYGEYELEVSEAAIESVHEEDGCLAYIVNPTKGSVKIVKHLVD
jgi:hypothetical protein